MKNSTLYILLFLLIFPGLIASLEAQDNKYKDIIKVDGVKNKKYLVSLSGITDVELFKPIEINLGMSLSAGIRLLYKPKLNTVVFILDMVNYVLSSPQHFLWSKLYIFATTYQLPSMGAAAVNGTLTPGPITKVN